MAVLIAIGVSASALSALLGWVGSRAFRVNQLNEALPDFMRAQRQPVFEVLASVGRLSVASRFADGPQISRMLDLAGRPEDVNTIVGLKVLLSASAALGCLVVGISVPVALAAGPLLALGAFRLPDFALARLAKGRQRHIAAQVPEFLELMLASTEAGLAPHAAFRRASEVLGGPLGKELNMALRRMDLGAPWGDALDYVLERTEVPSLQRLLGTIKRSQRLGGSVRGALRGVERDLRSERRSHAEEFARRAPVKMLFPLVFLILPAFLLLTVGPVLVATLRSLR